MGRRRSPADRRRGRDRLPRRGARSAGRRRADLRDRRPGPRDLRRLNARVRASARPQAAPDPGTAADASTIEPVARPRHPVYARVGRKLVDSLRNPTIVRDPAALAAFPVRPRGVRDAISRALRNEDEVFARTRWSDAISSAGLTDRYGGDRVGTRLMDSRYDVRAGRGRHAFAPIRHIGGDGGWYYGNPLWRVRGALDLPSEGSACAAGGAPTSSAGRRPRLLASRVRRAHRLLGFAPR